MYPPDITEYCNSKRCILLRDFPGLADPGAGVTCIPPSLAVAAIIFIVKETIGLLVCKFCIDFTILLSHLQ